MLEQNFQAADLGGNNSVSEWRLHWPEAEGELQPWRTQIISEIKAGRTAISRLISPVCTENLIRIDCVTEPPNVSGDDRPSPLCPSKRTCASDLPV
jgi:hypothetical protein